MEDEEDPEVRDARVRSAQEDGTCPLCGTELELEGYHERDSTYDRHKCTSCGWYYVECETWLSKR